MEAAGAPRLDAERRKLVRRSTRGAGQRGPSRRDKSRLLSPAYAVETAEERSARLRAAYGTCALGTLAHGAFHPTRLETRTKESNMYASRWAANPRRRK